ncbi:hypothetical protein M405DRAFT_23490 [Rhizopogon salebrosus TDB-379]|nr:hypothetical protein M405DRAFT_23490 [Rhizopogon salebrosus TDB-379]
MILMSNMVRYRKVLLSPETSCMLRSCCAISSTCLARRRSKSYRDPCESLKLANVPCRHCSTHRGFDFCRHPELMPHDFDGARVRWVCGEHGGEYDRIVIDMKLVRLVGLLERAFTQQDMRCASAQQTQVQKKAVHDCECGNCPQYLWT